MDERKNKMKNSYFPILFATDVGYAPHLASAVCSLLQNNQHLLFKIIVFASELPQEDRNKLQGVCDKFNAPIEFIHLNDEWFDGLILNHHFKKSNYYRLFAADLIDNDMCLYLDADIIVTGSVSEVINTKLDESFLAAVENPGFNRHKDLGMNSDSKYFNSGVMLLNLKKWRNTNLKEQVFSLVREKPEAIHFVDQCGLNGVVDGDWVGLDAKYNCQTYMLEITEFVTCSFEKLPIVVHYTGSSKPWHLNNTHPYKKIYWHYRNQTPYRSFFPDDISLLKIARYIAPSFVKRFVKNIIGTKFK